MDLGLARLDCGSGGLRRELTAPVDLHVDRPLLACSTVITGPRSASSSDSTPSRLLGMMLRLRCAAQAYLRQQGSLNLSSTAHIFRNHMLST